MTRREQVVVSTQAPAVDVPCETGEQQLEASIRSHHWLVLWLSIAVLVLSFTLQLREDGTVAVPALDRALPGVCLSQRMLGVSCPGCGLTRSFVSLAHARLADAVTFHRVGPIVFAIVALQVPYRIAALRRRGPKRGMLWTTLPRWICYGLIVLLAGNWLANALGISW